MRLNWLNAFLSTLYCLPEASPVNFRKASACAFIGGMAGQKRCPLPSPAGMELSQSAKASANGISPASGRGSNLAASMNLDDLPLDSDSDPDSAYSRRLPVFAPEDDRIERLAKLYYRNENYLDQKVLIDGKEFSRLDTVLQHWRLLQADEVLWLKYGVPQPAEHVLPDRALSESSRGKNEGLKARKAYERDEAEARKTTWMSTQSDPPASWLDILLANPNAIWGNFDDSTVAMARQRAKKWKLGFDNLENHI